jgi:predicted O-linked N-acetylglucosamine transferase (SPINDLY family)
MKSMHYSDAASASVLAAQKDELDRQFAPGWQLFLANRLQEAVSFYDEALAVETEPSARAYLLGNRAQCLNRLGRVGEALENTALALKLDPSQLNALCTRAYVFLTMERFQSCLECCDQGLAFHPDRIELLHNRTAALSGLWRNEEALATAGQILALNPNDAKGLLNRAVLLERVGRYDESAQGYEQAVVLAPNEPWLLGALLTAKLRSFDWARLDTLLDTIAARVAEGKPAVEPFRYLPACSDPQTLLHVAKIYVAERNPNPRQQTRFQPRDEQRAKIRIGYFSSDFRSHPVTELMGEVFELHDRERFETHAFSAFDDAHDAAQVRVKAAFDHFHNVDGMRPEDVAAMALSLKLDIAVDLNGHTLGARPQVFAMRVAPLQVAYLGFPASMGANFIDYIIADQVVIPPTHRQFYSEKVVALPHSFQPNDRQRTKRGPPQARSAYGLPEQGMVFACFNDPVKLQPAMFERWVRILQAVEGSVLWLYSRNSDIARDNLRRRSAELGLDPARIVFAPRLPLAEHFARHACADLFLDTLPFNAGATASCALWCGLPVLTVSGDTFTSRYGASLLTAAGLPELIATDLDAYQAIAVDLARSPDKLRSIRHKLDVARNQSALFDTPAFVRHLENAYRIIWRRFNEGLPPDHIDVRG